MNLLRPVQLKLARAETYARALADSIQNWTAANEFRARCELREGRLGFRLVLEDFDEAPPLDEWGLTTGDCVHNLRSALDNLAFALSRLVQDPPPRPRNISFPIYAEQRAFVERGKPRLAQMPAQAADLIERLQPFQRDGSAEQGTPEQDALVLLQGLNNADKHQVPLVTLIAPQTIGHAVELEFLNDEDAEANVPPDQTVWGGPLSSGVVLLEQRTTRPIAKVRGSFDSRAIVAIETDRGPLPAGATVRDLGYYTSLVVTQFRELFV